jgi:hypothetical protein
MCVGPACEARFNGNGGSSDGVDPLLRACRKCICSSLLLVEHLGIVDGRIWVAIHHGKVGEPMFDIRRLGDAVSPADGPNGRQMQAEFRDAIIDFIELCGLRLGGRCLAPNFGRVEVCVRDRIIRDFMVCVRFRLGEVEGLEALASTCAARAGETAIPCPVTVRM